MGLRGKSEKEKAEERMKKQGQIKQAYSESSIAQAKAKRKEKQKEQNKGIVFDVKTALRQIEQSLKGVKRKVKQYKDQEKNTRKKVEKVQVVENPPCNKEGAERYLEIAKTFLNHNTISSYQPAKTIERKCKGTIHTYHEVTITKHHLYDIDVDDCKTIWTTLLAPMVDATNKARGGRMLKNQEQTTVINKSITDEIGSNDDESSRGPGLADVF